MNYIKIYEKDYQGENMEKTSAYPRSNPHIKTKVEFSLETLKLKIDGRSYEVFENPHSS